MVMSLPITYYSKGNESLTYLSQNKAHQALLTYLVASVLVQFSNTCWMGDEIPLLKFPQCLVCWTVHRLLESIFYSFMLSDYWVRFVLLQREFVLRGFQRQKYFMAEEILKREFHPSAHFRNYCQKLDCNNVNMNSVSCTSSRLNTSSRRKNAYPSDKMSFLFFAKMQI